MPKKSVQDLMFAEIKEISVKVDKILEEKIPLIDKRLTKVEIKSGFFGTVGGFIAGAVAFLIPKP